MEISYDPTKNATNIAQGRPSFDTVIAFDFESAIVKEDDRKDYGETRFVAYGLIGARLHALVFTPRGEVLHIISLRKANQREVRNYEKSREIPSAHDA